MTLECSKRIRAALELGAISILSPDSRGRVDPRFGGPLGQEPAELGARSGCADVHGGLVVIWVAAIGSDWSREVELKVERAGFSPGRQAAMRFDDEREE